MPLQQWRLTAHQARLAADKVGPPPALAANALPTDKPKLSPSRRFVLARRLLLCRPVLATSPRPMRLSSTLALITIVPSPLSLLLLFPLPSLSIP